MMILYGAGISSFGLLLSVLAIWRGRWVWRTRGDIKGGGYLMLIGIMWVLAGWAVMTL